MKNYKLSKTDVCLEVLNKDTHVCTKEQSRRDKYIFFLVLFFHQICFAGIFILFLSYVYKYDIAVELCIKYFIYITIINSYFYMKNRKEEIVSNTIVRYLFSYGVNLLIIYLDYYMSFLINIGKNLNPISKFTYEQSSLFLMFISFILFCNAYYYSKGIEKFINIKKCSMALFCLLYTLESIFLLTLKFIKFLGIIDYSNEPLLVPCLAIILSQVFLFFCSRINTRKMKLIILPMMLNALYFWNFFKDVFVRLSILMISYKNILF
ncbi:hypothetical protein CWI38_0031p0080 [Hamiltosporidium tvaerminnensis]|uniref:Uncharacterized protein n=1 Tax=Hamiltosporidium tvaerminnensis TaxID=1176355 RepID=A0A4Q9M4N3_9MICR|nr:hypothetical protein CWI38_0031p0080 [Hamiltosporidium tvaerminnensis]